MSSDQVGGADVDSGRMLMSIADFKKSYQLGISRGAHIYVAKCRHVLIGGKKFSMFIFQSKIILEVSSSLPVAWESFSSSHRL